MARVIVVADHERPRVSGTWMDETVTSVRLDGGHLAEEFVERLGWAIQDAEKAQSRFVEELAPHSYRDVSSS